MPPLHPHTPRCRRCSRPSVRHSQDPDFVAKCRYRPARHRTAPLWHRGPAAPRPSMQGLLSVCSVHTTAVDSLCRLPSNLRWSFNRRRLPPKRIAVHSPGPESGKKQPRCSLTALHPLQAFCPAALPPSASILLFPFPQAAVSPLIQYCPLDATEGPRRPYLWNIVR